MGYLVDGAFLAACIGAYRVYTDRRKSVLSSSFDNYRLFWINLSRHSGDYMASSFFDVITKYPQNFRKIYAQTRSFLPNFDAKMDAFHQDVLQRTARYQIWAKFTQLGYLQRIVRLCETDDSLFGPCRAWKGNLLYTAPHLLGYVKDSLTREYLDTLCCLRDSHAGIIEGSPEQIAKLLNTTKELRRDIIQDIRKGHVLDRKSQSSTSIIHELRMEIETFLFAGSGPDPDRSTYIEKAIKDESDGVVERLFPFVEVIVDSKAESLAAGTALEKLAPNIEIFVPFLRLGTEIVAVGLGGREFVVCPLNRKLELSGSLVDGSKVSINHSDYPNEAITGTVVGRHGEAIKIVI